MLESLEVHCETCGEALQIGGDELFEFDCRCPVCDGLLVLQLEGPAVEPSFDFLQARPARAEPIPASPPGQRPGAFEDPRPTRASRPAPPPPPVAPAPAEPEETGAESTDTTSFTTSPTDTTSFAPSPTDTASFAPSPTDTASFAAAPGPSPRSAGVEPDDAIPTTRLERPPELAPETRPATPRPTLDDDDDDDDEAHPPDPYEVAARALDRAMTDSVRKTRRARRLSSDSSDSVSSQGSDVGTIEDDLDGLVEVVQVPEGGTTGRGSRTYERDQLLSRHVGAGGDPPTGTIDLDWLALIEDAPLDEEGASVSRVIITLPESAAPSEQASDEQVRQFQQAVERLEQGSSSQLTNLLSAEERARADQDTRSWTASGASEPSTKSWDAGVDDEEGEVTKPGWRAEQAGKDRDETTKPWNKEQLGAEPPSDKTADWDGVPDDKTVEWARPAKPPAPELEELNPETKSWPDETDADDEPPTAAHRRPSSRGRLESTQALEVNVRRLSDAAQRGAYQELYNRLFAGKNGDAPQVLMITSPRPEDGKSTVAANLALVLARQREDGAVLIDADPVGGGLLRAFGVRSRKEGLLEALQSDEPREYARQLKVDCPLDLVPLGIPSSDAEQLLASGRMRDFLGCVRRDYPGAVVVIDTASATNASPRALAQEVDGVIMVVRAGSTARDEVQRAVAAIGRERILGVVLNDARGVA